MVEILGQKVKPVSPHLDFLEKWEGKLNIGGHLNWKYDSETGVVQFKVGDRPLSDIGFGMTQLITTLLATYISCVGDSKPKGLINFVGRLILLEEPEANLHPKLQSMLADLIADATQNYKNQFIIETHSEYMIRKFQYLVAKGEMKPEDIVIYYFNDPAEEKKPLKITIDEHGSLSDDFGPGFYDEAATWELELLKLKRSKNRQN